MLHSTAAPRQGNMPMSWRFSASFSPEQPSHVRQQLQMKLPQWLAVSLAVVTAMAPPTQLVISETLSGHQTCCAALKCLRLACVELLHCVRASPVAVATLHGLLTKRPGQHCTVPHRNTMSHDHVNTTLTLLNGCCASTGLAAVELLPYSATSCTCKQSGRRQQCEWQLDQFQSTTITPTSRLDIRSQHVVPARTAIE